MILQPASPRRSRRKFRPWNPTTYTAILLIVAIVSVAGWKMEESGWMENSVTHVMSSPLRFLQGTRAYVLHTVKEVRLAIHTHKEFDLLREEAERLRQENQELRIAAADAVHLRALLDLPDRTPFRALSALVINRDLGTSFALIINRGKEDGVAVNQPVLSASQGLVGRIERALSRTSRVQLITDYNSVVGVRVENKSLEAIVRGSPKEGLLIMSDLFLTGDAHIVPEPGDRILTSGFGRVFPPDLLVGEVIGPDEIQEGAYRVAPTVDTRIIYEILILLDIERREELELLEPSEVS